MGLSFLALRRVGPEGAVIGVDRSPEAIAAAQQRAAAARVPNAQFITSDLHALDLDEPVDALIGRLVLMYLPNAADVVRRLVSFVKPAGIVMFQELDTTSATSEPTCEVFETAGERLNQTLRRAGVDLRAGLRLPSIFQQAGLPEPKTLQWARVEHGPLAQGYMWIEQLTRTLLPVMQQTGVATAEEVQVDTLAARIREEVVAKQAVIVLPPLIGAWVQKPLPVA